MIVRRGSLVLIAVFLGIVTPAYSQRVVFNPSISVVEGYTDNVGFVENSSDNTPDYSTTFVFTLPVSRNLRKSILGFSYRASFVKFRHFTELDNDNHRLGLTLALTPGPRSKLGLNASYDRSQDQGRLENQGDTDLFLTHRIEREVYGGGLDYSSPLGRYWSWRFSAGASQARFDRIEEFDGPQEVEDRSTYQGNLHLTRNFFRTANVSIRYGYRLHELDISGDENVHTLGVGFDKVIGRSSSVGLELSGYKRSNDADSGATTNGISAGLSFNHTAFRDRLNIELGAAVNPSSGGSLTGTSTNKSAGLSLSMNTGRKWSWGTSYRLVEREPTDPELATLRTWVGGGTIERAFLPSVGVQLHARYVDQSSTDPATGVGSFYRASLGVVWYPLGRTDLAARQRSRN